MFIISHWPTKFSTRGSPVSLTRLDALGAPALQSVPAGAVNGCCGLTPAPVGLLCAPHRPAHPCRWETFRTKTFLFWISQCFWKGKTWTFRQSRKRTADLGFEPPILPLCSCVNLGEPVALHFLTTERETKHGVYHVGPSWQRSLCSVLRYLVICEALFTLKFFSSSLKSFEISEFKMCSPQILFPMHRCISEF